MRIEIIKILLFFVVCSMTVRSFAGLNAAESVALKAAVKQMNAVDGNVEKLIQLYPLRDRAVLKHYFVVMGIKKVPQLKLSKNIVTLKYKNKTHKISMKSIKKGTFTVGKKDYQVSPVKDLRDVFKKNGSKTKFSWLDLLVGSKAWAGELEESYMWVAMQAMDSVPFVGAIIARQAWTQLVGDMQLPFSLQGTTVPTDETKIDAVCDNIDKYKQLNGMDYLGEFEKDYDLNNAEEEQQWDKFRCDFYDFYLRNVKLAHAETLRSMSPGGKVQDSFHGLSEIGCQEIATQGRVSDGIKMNKCQAKLKYGLCLEEIALGFANNMSDRKINNCHIKVGGGTRLQRIEDTSIGFQKDSSR